MMIDNSFNDLDRKEILGMEFIRQTDGNYLIKNSNGKVVSEKEKIMIENNELVLKDFSSNKCQEETTKKISKNKKKMEVLDEDTISKTGTIKE